jgi:hypothetical protein
MLVPDRDALRLVLENLHAHAVGRHHERLVQPAVVARQHLNTGGLPLGDPLLDVVDDEADMVHHRSLGAAVALLVVEDQVDVDTREHHQRVPAGHEQLAAHGQEESLVRVHVLRNDVPMTHGHAGLVERGRLRHHARGGRGQSTQENDSDASRPILHAPPPASGAILDRIDGKRLR